MCCIWSCRAAGLVRYQVLGFRGRVGEVEEIYWRQENASGHLGVIPAPEMRRSSGKDTARLEVPHTSGEPL